MKPFYTLLILFIPFVGFGQLTYIPDDNFEQALIDWGLDDVLDDYVLTENIDTITYCPNETINTAFCLNNLNIDNLTGIEDFTAITKLDCSSNNLVNLDLSQNINLIELDASKNKLKNLILSDNATIQKLNLFYNEFEFLDLSNINIAEGSVIYMGANYFLDSLNLKNLNIEELSILNLNSTSVKCVLVDDISDLDFVNLYTDNTPNLSFSETNCLFINSLS